MSIVKTNYKNAEIATLSQRLAKIYQIGEQILHTNDFANIFEIKNPNTLHMTLTRYVKSGVLFRIYRGLYAMVPIEKLDRKLLGLKALHEYSYISTESILVQAGIVLQMVPNITMLSSRSKRFQILNQGYLSRQLADQYLFNPIGVSIVNGIRVANASRAVADLLYFNPHVHLDAPRLVNWREVQEIQKTLNYPLTINRYDFAKSSRR